MKALSIRPLFLFLAFLMPTLLWGNRTIKGCVAFEGINIPNMASIRISAFDADGGTDEFMGQSYLGESGVFCIKYDNHKWDPFPMEHTTWWRPDIYVIAEIYEDDQWITVYRSETYEDWSMGKDLEISIYIEFNEPIVAATQFHPLVHGFYINNKQKGNPDLNELSGGLCFSMLDYYYHHVPTYFPNASEFIRYFTQRQKAANQGGNVQVQTVEWMAKPDRACWNKRHHIGYFTQVELEKIREKIEDGKPAIAVLIPEIFPEQDALIPSARQVIIYRYEYDLTRKKTHLWVYDPTLTNGDEAILTVVHGYTDGHIKILYNQAHNCSFQGFFLNPYDLPEVRKSFANLIEGPLMQNLFLSVK